MLRYDSPDFRKSRKIHKLPAKYHDTKIYLKKGLTSGKLYAKLQFVIYIFGGKIHVKGNNKYPEKKG